jgi:hypothetical protein
VIKNLPRDNALYTQSWIKEEIIKSISKYGGRILNPARDIIFSQEGAVVAILDGFDPMILNEEIEEIKKQDDLEAEADILEEDSKKAKKEEPKEEPLAPTEWNCAVCTFGNSIGAPTCDMCTSPRPPMEVIIA